MSTLHASYDASQVMPVLEMAALGMARVSACFAWLPFLSSGVLPARRTRAVVSAIVVMGLWPAVSAGDVPAQAFPLAVAAALEAVIGLALGLATALPVHVFQAWGSLVDNQRGANMGSAVDPLSGSDATESSHLMEMMCVVVFLASGGMTEVISVVQQSFLLFPIGSGAVPDVDRLLGYVAVVVGAALRVSAPVLLVLLISECALGILSRFAAQMNAFSVSLALKSVLAFAALAVYAAQTVPGEVTELWGLAAPLDMLRGAWSR